ncbi:hypothetical protein D3C85_1465070 [compost metagenome]
MALKRASKVFGISLAQVTLISPGRFMFAPMIQECMERTTGVSKCTTWPLACTMASVRPAQESTTGAPPATRLRAFSRDSWIEGTPARWRWKPR